MIEVKLDIKPIPVPLAYQPIYKIIILLAILRYGCMRPHRATFLKLHLYMWSIRSFDNYRVLEAIGKGKRNTIAPWNYEPGLDRVVTLSIVNGYCTREIRSGELQIQLSDKGMELLGKVELKGFFATDINKIKGIGRIAQDKLASANINWTT